MPTLVVSLKSRQVAKHEFETGPVRIGRHPSSDIVIDDDTVSRQHAVVKQVGTSWILQNTEGCNGVFVNGVRMEIRSLEHGDRIGVGRATLEFFRSGEAARLPVLPPAVAKAGQPPLASTKPTRVLSSDQLAVLHNASPSASSAHLVWKDSRGKSTVFVLARDPVFFGHGPSVHIDVGWSLFAGKRSAAVLPADGGYLLLRLSNWVRIDVNGVKIAEGTNLSAGDKIRVAGARVVFQGK